MIKNVVNLRSYTQHIHTDTLNNKHNCVPFDFTEAKDYCCPAVQYCECNMFTTSKKCFGVFFVRVTVLEVRNFFWFPYAHLQSCTAGRRDALLCI